MQDRVLLIRCSLSLERPDGHAVMQLRIVAQASLPLLGLEEQPPLIGEVRANLLHIDWFGFIPFVDAGLRPLPRESFAGCVGLTRPFFLGQVDLELPWRLHLWADKLHRARDLNDSLLLGTEPVGELNLRAIIRRRTLFDIHVLPQALRPVVRVVQQCLRDARRNHLWVGDHAFLVLRRLLAWRDSFSRLSICAVQLLRLSRAQYLLGDTAVVPH